MASRRPLTKTTGIYDVMSHAFSYVHAHILIDLDNVDFLRLFLDVVCAF